MLLHVALIEESTIGRLLTPPATVVGPGYVVLYSRLSTTVSKYSPTVGVSFFKVDPDFTTLATFKAYILSSTFLEVAFAGRAI